MANDNAKADPDIAAVDEPDPADVAVITEGLAAVVDQCDQRREAGTEVEDGGADTPMKSWLSMRRVPHLSPAPDRPTPPYGRKRPGSRS